MINFIPSNSYIKEYERTTSKWLAKFIERLNYIILK